MRIKFTGEMHKFFFDYTPGHTLKETSEEFKKRFGIDISPEKIRNYRSHHHLKSGLTGGTPKGKSELFPPEVYDYIVKINYGRTVEEVTRLVNEKFFRNYTRAQIKSLRQRKHLISGLTGRFEKGSTPSNKGRKGWCPPGAEKGWFKKGHRSHNTDAIGTEIIDKNGYHKTKIAEPNIWEFNHRILWREHFGEIPEGCVIIFKDGNKDNLNISNLQCITKSEHVVMNRCGLRAASAELTEIGILTAKLQIKTYGLEKKNK